jgi:hypothetical protein
VDDRPGRICPRGNGRLTTVGDNGLDQRVAAPQRVGAPSASGSIAMTDPHAPHQQAPGGEDELTRLAQALAAALRHDAAALEGDGAPDLDALAAQLEALLTRIGARPDAAGKRALVHVLDEVQRFHARLKAAHATTGEAITGAAQRRLARQAYGEAERYARGDGAT